ncbi:MAG: type II toxin-antitoxin system VapC family toxin [Limisphaerales bacterium]
MRTYYWDSSVFCAYFNDEAGRADVVEELLGAAQAEEILIITSSFALVEVLKIEGHLPLKETDEAALVAFFQYPFVKYVDANRQLCQSARHLIWKFPALRPKDSVHLASALAYVEREHLDGLFSYDADFTRLDGKITPEFPISHPFVEQRNLKLQPASAQSKLQDQTDVPRNVTPLPVQAPPHTTPQQQDNPNVAGTPGVEPRPTP